MKTVCDMASNLPIRPDNRNDTPLPPKSGPRIIVSKGLEIHLQIISTGLQVILRNNNKTVKRNRIELQNYIEYMSTWKRQMATIKFLKLWLNFGLYNFDRIICQTIVALWFPMKTTCSQQHINLYIHICTTPMQRHRHAGKYTKKSNWVAYLGV